MNKQKSEGRNDVLPLRLDEEIRRDERDSRESVGKNLQEASRTDSYLRSQESEYDLVYHINETDIGFEDVLEALEGVKSEVLEKDYDREGNKSTNYLGDQEISSGKYMEWFFLPEEVFDVREVDVMSDGRPAWNDVYWVAGYSSVEEDRREFGPFDSFEGPPLKYAMIALSDPGSDSVYDHSIIEGSTYHPQVKMDQYTEDGTFPQEVLEEGPDFSWDNL